MLEKGGEFRRFNGISPRVRGESQQGLGTRTIKRVPA